jgi:hypothetical protein
MAADTDRRRTSVAKKVYTVGKSDDVSDYSLAEIV